MPLPELEDELPSPQIAPAIPESIIAMSRSMRRKGNFAMCGLANCRSVSSALGPRRRTLRRSSVPVAPGSPLGGLSTGLVPAPESPVERAVVGLPSRQRRGCFSARRHQQWA